MKRTMKQAPAECGVCGRWTERGSWFESGQRNPFTGEIPWGNFICERCQHEARVLREVGSAWQREVRRRKPVFVGNGSA
jgi:C4-type Zn-finger protein